MTGRRRTVFLGTGAFAIPALAVLADHPAIELIAVVSAPPRRGMRGRLSDPPVAEWAIGQGLNVLRPERLRSDEALAALRALRPELLVLADYGQIVPKAVLDLPPHGALNLHPSLLPRHRGATPIPAAILAGDHETGVSLIRMDAGLDSGPIVAQSRMSLSGSETAPELETALSAAAAALLAASLEGWLAGTIAPESQDDRRATITRPLRREDGRLDPGRPVQLLERQVRAYQPWPGSFIDTPTGRLTVWRAHIAPADDRQVAATLGVTATGGLVLIAGDGLLELDDVQPAGGRRMSGADALRGRPALAGASVALSADRES